LRLFTSVTGGSERKAIWRRERGEREREREREREKERGEETRGDKKLKRERERRKEKDTCACRKRMSEIALIGLLVSLA